MKAGTMDDKFLIILAAIPGIGALYNNWRQNKVEAEKNEAQERDDNSDNRRKDFEVLITEFRSQNETLKNRVDKLDTQLKQQSSQLEVQNKQISKLSKMLQKAITVIEDLGKDPRDYGIRDITKEE